MRYEWDEAKNRENERKHGVSFEHAALVFDDECCLVCEDRIEDEVAVILLVVHIYRENNDGEEIIRIISARAAEKHERRRYQKQAME